MLHRWYCLFMLPVEDLTGHRFGHLTVERLVNPALGHRHWRCRCACGRTSDVYHSALVQGKRTTCGCAIAKRATGHDLTGRVFERLTVLALDPRRGQRAWQCACACGRTLRVQQSNLLYQHQKSCGCWITRTPENLVGQVFGRLTVEVLAPRSRTGKPRWQCRCACGNVSIVHAGALKSGAQSSCGCWKNEQARQRMLTHGRSRTGEYRSWAAAKTRCFNH